MRNQEDQVLLSNKILALLAILSAKELQARGQKEKEIKLKLDARVLISSPNNQSLYNLIQPH